MANGDPGQVLHDRATRGLPLTVEEEAQLADWYAAQDRDEIVAMPEDIEVDSLPTLQVEVRSGIQQLLTAAQRIQELTDQNDNLRREIGVLQQRLARRPTARPV